MTITTRDERSVTGRDFFHTGIIVDDVEATAARLTEHFGYEWCPPTGGTGRALLPTGEREWTTTFIHTRSEPRIELMSSVQSTFMMPVPGSGIHHLGYWSKDVASDGAELERLGYVNEAYGLLPDDTRFWAFHLHPAGYRVELVSRSIQGVLEQYWAS